MFIVELLVIFQNVHVDIGKQVYMWILNLGVHVDNVHTPNLVNFTLYAPVYNYVLISFLDTESIQINNTS